MNPVHLPATSRLRAQAMFAVLMAAALAQPQSSRVLPAVDLRGYGKVSGVQQTSPKGSALRIQTESEAKARLLQAKYLSDASLSPEVRRRTLRAGAVEVSALEVSSQGWVAALRAGTFVHLLAAKDASGMATLLKALPAAALSQSKASVEVPMWLDRWDKFNFRHYYRPWEKPQGKSEADYDFTSEFAWARQQEQAGFVFSMGLLATDSAQNITESGWQDWAIEAAKLQNLPVAIHLGGNAGSEPSWLMDGYRDQAQAKMPAFTGNFHSLMSPFLGGMGVLSWSATTGEDARLGLLQRFVRQHADSPNTVSLLEPHGELYHGDQDKLLEFGPVADVAYREFLKEKYGTPAKVAARWKRPLEGWDDARVPEMAAFAGWGPEALDLGGRWRIGYEETLAPVAHGGDYGYNKWGSPESKPAPEAWYADDFDDKAWPAIVAPGDDHQLFLKKRPAVFRRQFEVPAEWRAKNGKVWLYLWDLNLATGQEVRLVLNGKEVGRDKIKHNVLHWTAVDVTEVLRNGSNTLAVRLPQGYLAYRTYLSLVAPRQYPDLGEGLNAQWVDFSDFAAWTRVKTVGRGMDMIRQVNREKQITMMSPFAYADGVKAHAVASGGEFHDTGAMGAYWTDQLAAITRGADMPVSVEPGNPAGSLEEWKKQWGLYQTEGIQGIDYYMHVGDVFWKPEIRADYEAHRKQIALLGRSHTPKAEVAVLYSDRLAQLTGFPWGFSPNANLGGGYDKWNAAAVLRGHYPYDGLTQSSFARGEANPYRVIIDSNTSLMDERQVDEIERWVREGGTFVTFAQTGRHTPEKADAWPISRLTGYAVSRIDALNPDGSIGEGGTLKAAPGQTIFALGWEGQRANGLHLKKTASDAQDLLLWNDGTVAAGARKLGEGQIVQLGAKFSGADIFDRVEPGMEGEEIKALRRMLVSILDSQKVQPEPAWVEQSSDLVWLRSAVTNDGLYDTWSVWNWSKDKPQTVSIVLKDRRPSFALDARDGARKAISNGKIENIELAPLQAKVFMTPRGRIEAAPYDWFDLQRKWWRGTTPPSKRPLPDPKPRRALDLADGWQFRPLKPTEDAAGAATDWSSPQSIGIWDTKRKGTVRGVYRRTFEVPAVWKNGRVSLWITSWFLSSFVEKGRVWLDGEEVKGLNDSPYLALGLSTLKPGSRHTLLVEASSTGALAGLRGQAWLSYEPTPAQRVDLAGEWTPSQDGLRDDAPITLPGPFNTQFLKRKVTVPMNLRGKNVAITVDGDSALISVIVNGTLVRHHHHRIGDRWSLNVTPFVRWGAENDIELVRFLEPGSGVVREASLGFFDPADFP